MNKADAPIACRDCFWLFAGALFLRMLCAWKLGAFLALPPDTRFDDGVFLQIARSFLGLSPLTVPTHPPGYSFFLMPFVLAGSWGIPLAIFAQWLLGASIAPLTYRLSRAMGYLRESALAAGVLVALDPMMIFFSTRLMSEMPFIFLVLMFFLHWLKAWEGGLLGSAAIAGMIAALATLTRGVMLPFGGILAFVAYLNRRRQPRWISLVAACGLAWALTMAPWTARNWLRFHRFVPVSVQGGWNFYEGMTVDEREIEKRPRDMGQEAAMHRFNDIFESNAYFQRKANLWIKAHPMEFAWLSIRKAFKFWRPFPYPPYSRAVRWGVGSLTLVVFALAILALSDGISSNALFPFVIGWALLLTAIHSFFASNLRYRLPLQPFLAITAGAGLSILRRRWPRARD